MSLQDDDGLQALAAGLGEHRGQVGERGDVGRLVEHQQDRRGGGPCAQARR